MRFSFARTRQLGIGILCGIIILRLIISLLVLHQTLNQLHTTYVSQQAKKDHFEAIAFRLVTTRVVFDEYQLQDASEFPVVVEFDAIRQHLMALAQLDLTSVERQRLGLLMAHEKRLRRLIEIAMAAGSPTLREKIAHLITEAVTQATALRKQAAVSITLTHRDLAQSLRLTSVVMAVGTGLTVVVGIMVGLWLSRALARHIKQIGRATQELGQGNLQHRICSPFTDEVGQLAAGIDEMAEQLSVSTHRLNVTLAELTEARNVSEWQAQELRAGSEALSVEIAERRRTEEALRESEARYRTLIESSVQGLLIHVDGHICFSNPATARIFGYDRPDALIGMNYLRLVAPHERDRLAHYIEGRMRGEIGSPTYEGLGVKKDGSPIWCEYLVSQVLWDDKPAVMSTLLDITARKHADLALQEAKEAAEAASKAQQGFLANMSHELRTPLHAILSYSAFGLKKATSVSPEKLHGYFNQIDQSSQALLTLLNDLLDLAKLESGKMTFTFETVDLNQLLLRVAEEFRALSEERQIAFEVTLPETSSRLSVDQGRILQVLRNLVSNAIKFTPAGRAVTLHLEQREGAVRIGVCDQGPGIPPSELETVFDKFVQSSRTATGAGGTGLGLSICREIVAEHAGQVWAEPYPDGGAMFVVELPMPIAEVAVTL